MEISPQVPEWALDFLVPHRYKGVKGGRGSGKSHFFATLAVVQMLADPHTDFLCLREVQQSLKFSAKKLIESKIEAMGVGHHFKIVDNEIRRIGPSGMTTGVMLFQGMKDHTAESIKSMEGFNRAWFEEASRMSKLSLELLLPTIREPDSEIWFSWNPGQATDPIEKFFVESTPPDSVLAHVNFDDNPFCPREVFDEATRSQLHDADRYPHVWLGQYDTKSDDQVLGGRYIVEDFEPQSEWDGPYYGSDFGFSSDPQTLITLYVDSVANRIYIYREDWETGVEVDDLEAFFDRQLMPVKRHPSPIIRCDNARPELISHLCRHGYPGAIGAEKWNGSVEDGISKLRSFDKIVIHMDCKRTAQECVDYKYKRDRLTDDVLPVIIDRHNHCIDAIRYAIEPLTKLRARSFWDNLKNVDFRESDFQATRIDLFTRGRESVT